MNQCYGTVILFFKDYTYEINEYELLTSVLINLPLFCFIYLLLRPVVTYVFAAKEFKLEVRSDLRGHQQPQRPFKDRLP